MISSPESKEHLTSETENPVEKKETSSSSAPTSAPAPALSPAFLEFEAKLSALTSPEEKIALGLEFMAASMQQEGTARFREFWEASKKVVTFFKENMNSAIRSKLWEDHKLLTKEARRLKETLEEQSAAAVENIEQAISYLETDKNNFDELLKQGLDIQFPTESPTIQSKISIYNQVQRELNLLNVLAGRLNGLRKEVVKTDMRMRFKTKFFKRLSEIGDHIFPRKKLLVDEISGGFEKDVDHFIANHFKGEEVVGAPYFALREEIKALQGMAKILTLSSSVFNRTRLKLSECWDKIKVLEKEHKKEIFAKKQVSHENRAELEKKVEELSTRSAEMPINELDKAIEEISKEMRQTDLHRGDVIFLRDQLAALRAPHLAVIAERAKAQEEAEAEKVRARKEKVDDLRTRLEQTILEGSNKTAEELDQLQTTYKEEIKLLGVSKMEQQQFERILRQMKDLVQEAKEKAILNMSDDDRSALGHLRELLNEKKARRLEVKEQIEAHKRALTTTGLNISKGMQVRKMMQEEKELLDQTNDRIEELEQKIAELEG